MTNKNITMWIIAALVIIGGAIFLYNQTTPKVSDTTSVTPSIIESVPGSAPVVITQPVDTTTDVSVTKVIEPSLPETGFPPKE